MLRAGRQHATQNNTTTVAAQAIDEPTLNLLVSLLRGDWSAASRLSDYADNPDNRAGTVTLSSLARQAGAQRVAPWLYVRAPAGPLKDALRPLALASAADTAKKMATYASVHALLDRAGIPHVPLKGAALQHLYQPACRPLGDLDLLVTHERLRDAQSALLHAGATQDVVEKHPELRDVYMHLPQLTFQGVHIELHQRLNERLKWELPDLWGEVRDGQLSPRATLHHLCVHAWHHGAINLGWLLDVRLLLQACPETHEWALQANASTREAVQSTLLLAEQLAPGATGKLDTRRFHEQKKRFSIAPQWYHATLALKRQHTLKGKARTLRQLWQEFTFRLGQLFPGLSMPRAILHWLRD